MCAQASHGLRLEEAGLPANPALIVGRVAVINVAGHFIIAERVERIEQDSSLRLVFRSTMSGVGGNESPKVALFVFGDSPMGAGFRGKWFWRSVMSEQECKVTIIP